MMLSLKRDSLSGECILLDTYDAGSNVQGFWKVWKCGLNSGCDGIILMRSVLREAL